MKISCLGWLGTRHLGDLGMLLLCWDVGVFPMFVTSCTGAPPCKHVHVSVQKIMSKSSSPRESNKLQRIDMMSINEDILIPLLTTTNPGPWMTTTHLSLSSPQPQPEPQTALSQQRPLFAYSSNNASHHLHSSALPRTTTALNSLGPSTTWRPPLRRSTPWPTEDKARRISEVQAR